MADSARDKLARWPANKAVGLIIRGQQEDFACRDFLRRHLPSDTTVKRWWILDEENQYVGENGHAQGPEFAWTALLTLSDPGAAERCLETLEQQAPSASLCVFLAEPPPSAVRPILELIQGILNRFPLRVSTGATPDINPDWLGGVNPTPEAQAHADTLPQNAPVAVLNLHRYKQTATDPFTGEVASGARIAGRYLKRGFLTFTRVGGHVSWTADCRGQLRGPIQPHWQVAGLIWYPGRRAFANMSLDPRFARAAGYRKAGLEAASVSHTCVVASSDARDIRP